jgi:hypothetical protein
VRVPQPGEGLTLGPEAPAGIGRCLRKQGLERITPFGHVLVGHIVDHAHAARADFPQHPETTDGTARARPGPFGQALSDPGRIAYGVEYVARDHSANTRLILEGVGTGG